MTNENQSVENNEVRNVCFCQSEGVKRFLITALGSFVGVFCAICLFAALNKPPMPPCPYAPMMRAPIHCPCHLGKQERGKFQHKFEQRNFKRVEKRDFREQPPVKVNYENIK